MNELLTVEQQCELIEALVFYAIPGNWHGVYMIGNGPMVDDWGEVADDQYPDGKPGKFARETIKKLCSELGVS